jgi:hypothetical protein
MYYRLLYFNDRYKFATVPFAVFLRKMYRIAHMGNLKLYLLWEFYLPFQPHYYFPLAPVNFLLP